MSGQTRQGSGSPLTNRRDRRFTGPLALVLAATALALEGGAIALLLANVSGGAPIEPSANFVGGFVLGIAYPLVGGLLAARRPGNAIGWIFLAIGLSQATNAFTNEDSMFGLVTHPGPLPLAPETSWRASWTRAPLAVAASTLVVAALFQPLRRRVQSVVDRRFNRSRYDAERTVAAFSGRLREEVALEDVSAAIRTVVAQTVAPAAVGLWMRERGRS